LGRILSWSAIGYGGLLILVIVLGILGSLLLLGGENSPSNDTASTDNNDTTSAADSNNDAASSSGQEDTSYSRASNDQKKSANDISDESTVTLNQPIEVGDARWVVTSADRLTRLQNQFGSQLPKQGNFVVVNFTFTNKGRDAKTLSQRTINLYDSSGRKYRPDTDTSVYIPIEKNMFLLGQVNPGVSKDGEVIFSVAPDATGLKLQLSNTNF
jgi:hypothetical protein